MFWDSVFKRVNNYNLFNGWKGDGNERPIYKLQSIRTIDVHYLYTFKGVYGAYSVLAGPGKDIRLGPYKIVRRNQSESEHEYRCCCRVGLLGITQERGFSPQHGQIQVVAASSVFQNLNSDKVRAGPSRHEWCFKIRLSRCDSLLAEKNHFVRDHDLLVTAVTSPAVSTTACPWSTYRFMLEQLFHLEVVADKILLKHHMYFLTKINLVHTAL
ncbi:hypothetical protein J6590_054446 [Homalodisca vitripennis]|nr:hypothetical protein J6590_054446 [Homalodisca vitripennis]